VQLYLKLSKRARNLLLQNAAVAQCTKPQPRAFIVIIFSRVNPGSLKQENRTGYTGQVEKRKEKMEERK
jgi:hypothetical protein